MSEYQITEQSLKQAIEENIYWQVVARHPTTATTATASKGSSVQPKIKKCKLRGAIHQWKKPDHKHDLYVPSLRIVGTEEELEAWMKRHSYTQDQIDTAIDEAFGLENINDPEFKALTAVVKKPRSTLSSADALNALRQFNLSLKDKNQRVKLCNSKNEEKTSPSRRIMRKNKVTPTSTSEDADTNEQKDETVPKVVVDRPIDTKMIIPSVLKKKIEQRIKALKEGFVLDVSDFDAHGNGIKIIQKPHHNDRSRHGIADLPLVSFTEEPFEHVIHILVNLKIVKVNGQ